MTANTKHHFTTFWKYHSNLPRKPDRCFLSPPPSAYVFSFCHHIIDHLRSIGGVALSSSSLSQRIVLQKALRCQRPFSRNPSTSAHTHQHAHGVTQSDDASSGWNPCWCDQRSPRYRQAATFWRGERFTFITVITVKSQPSLTVIFKKKKKTRFW